MFESLVVGAPDDVLRGLRKFREKSLDGSSEVTGALVRSLEAPK